MKRSHSSDEEDNRPITENKKSRNEPVLPNDNYYVIRKGKSSSSASSLSLDGMRSESKFKDSDRRSSSSLFDKRDRFAPFDRKDRFHDRKDRSFEKPSFSTPSSFEKSSLKSKSTSALNQSEPRLNPSSTTSGYSIRLPAKFKLDDLAGQLGAAKRDSKTSSSYLIRSSCEIGKLKIEFIQMDPVKKLKEET